MALRLYQHNLTAYRAVVKTLKEEGKTCIIHPTGTGKSYIAFKLIEEHPEHQFLWLGPSEYIYQVQVDKLKRKQGIAFTNIQFHTYAWLMKNEKEMDNLQSDFIVLDEFHRVGARHWGGSVQKLIDKNPKAYVFGMTATNIRYLDNRRDMAVELFDNKVSSEFDLIEAMVRGYLPAPTYIICSYYYEEKYREYENRNSKIKSPVIREENNKVLQKLKRANEQALGMNQIFARYIMKKNSKFIVFCPSLEKMYELMTKVPEWFAEIDKLPHVYCVHSHNIDSSADFQGFQEDDSEHIKLLFTIDMLNEGIHVDGVDGVVLLRPTISPIIYKQQIGRALATDAEGGPLIFDLVNNFDSLFNIRELEKEFQSKKRELAAAGEYVTYEEFHIIDELRDSRQLFATLLRNLESGWDIYYQQLVQYREKHGTVKLPRRYTTEDGLQLGKWLNRQRSNYRAGKLSEEQAILLNELGVDFRTDQEVKFVGWLKCLTEYKIEHGHLLVPCDYVTPDGKRLGNYVSNIRSRYQNHRLLTSYIERLEAIGFTWSAMEYYWEQNYRKAEEYYYANGHINVPKRYKTEDGTKLGLWIATQRNVYLKRVSGDLTPEQKVKLDKLHMKWERESEEELFEIKLQALMQYKKETRDALVKKTYVTKDGIALGQWVLTLRLKYSHNKLQRLLPEGTVCPKSYITIEQEQRLNEAGMVWNINDTLWNEMYEDAKRYYEAHGHLHSVSSTVKGPKGKQLFAWLSSQQDAYRKNGKSRRLLTEEQIEKLQAIGIEWELKTNRHFNQGMEALIQYKKEHHSLLIPVNYKTPDGYQLGRWASRQRSLKRKNKLTPDREQHLNKYGFIWDYTEHYWNNMYEEAKKYYQQHGNLNMPQNYTTPTGAKLWQWKMDMRKRYKNNNPKDRNITEEQIKKLEAIGMAWKGKER